MATETVVTTTETTIQLMNGTMTLQPTRVVMAATENNAANTVGALREELGLSGHICVNDVDSSDATPIAEDDRVVHVAGNKRGGNQ
jgi:hypothetical protein|tara:strand:- start:236 stop:493 length:258 start_codon:yes stop_codon:yes gene_type:complete